MYKDIGNVDAVVSATGGATFKALSDMTLEDNNVAIQSKLLGQINLVLIGQHYLNENGSFTLTSGIMMDDPIRLGSSAAMANGGVAGFVTSAAVELKRGLRINNVSPNVVEEALDKYGEFFKGFTAVPVEKWLMLLLKVLKVLKQVKHIEFINRNVIGYEILNTK